MGVRSCELPRCWSWNTSVWLLILSLARSVGGIASCGRCDGGSTLSCPNSLDWQYEINYQGDPKSSLLLVCDHQTPRIDLSYVDGCSFPDVKFVRIKLCPVFNASLGSVLREIGVNPTNVKYLIWENSRDAVEGLQSWHLEGLENLTTLHIQSNYFSSIAADLLKPTPLLKRIVINDNYFSVLPAELFSHTPQLTSIELGKNALSSVPADLLSSLPSLAVFTLRGNQIPTIPQNLFIHNANLQSVDLSSNNIQSVEPDTFKNLKSLHTLNLRNNRMQSLDESIFSECFNLSTIYLTHNSLTSLPPNIFQQTVLKFVYIGYNKLQDVTGLFKDLSTLQNVTLHKNQITKLSSDLFSTSPNIVRLDLQHNSIVSLEEGVFNGLSKLRLILLNNNGINELPRRLFVDCTSLLQVYMQKNYISEVPLDTFPQSSNIALLDLSHNNLSFGKSFFNPNPLNTLTSIEQLNLKNNKIEQISNDFLYIFTKLKVLDLQYNSLTSLQNSDFHFLTNNLTLLLQHNKISTVRIDRKLGHVGGKKTLAVSLEGNPLSCDCHIYEFLRFAQMKPPFPMNEQFNLLVEDAASALCVTPVNDTPTRIDSVDTEELLCKLECSSECPCFLRQHDRALLMDCSLRMLATVPNFTKSYLNFHENFDLHLDLSENNLENIDFLNSSHFSRLRHLNLAGNNLQHINASLLNEDLLSLDLRNNNFTSLTIEFVSYLSNNTDILLQLGQNPWWCDCQLQILYEFIRDNFERVLDRSEVLCEESDAPVQELTLEQLCPFLTQPAALATVTVIVVILLLFTIVATAMWFRNKELVKVWLYTHKMCLWYVSEQEIDAEKQYDAFISYSYKDESFVNNNLVPGLEKGDPQYKVCLHYRDWVPGEYIADQIMTSVKDSRRIIVVLSKNFLESVWGQMEFKAAHRQALKDKTNRIIVIVYGDVPPQDDLDDDLKLYVTSKTYLKWGDQRFWERLRYAMPHAKYSKYSPRKNQVDKMELRKSPHHVEDGVDNPALQTEVKEGAEASAVKDTEDPFKEVIFAVENDVNKHV